MEEPRVTAADLRKAGFKPTTIKVEFDEELEKACMEIIEDMARASDRAKKSTQIFKSTNRDICHY